MTSPTTSPAPSTATAVIPPHRGTGPISPQKIRMARVRIALQELTADVSVGQAACRALEAVLDLQSLVQAQRGVATQESRHG